MARRQREWAKRARLSLIIELGGICVDCGNSNLAELEIDHKFRRKWDLRKHEQSWRVSIYRREAREGKLTVRCISCNPSKGKPTRDCPF